MPGRKKTTRERVTPTPLGYSFADCPDDELSACCCYEYLAASPLIVDAVARFRAGETNPLAKAVVLLFPPDIYWVLRENRWPSPYLGIQPEARRRTRPSLSQVRKGKRKNLAHLVTPWPYLKDAANVARIVVFYVPPACQLWILKEAVGDLLKTDYPNLLKRDEWSQRRKRGRGSPAQQDRAALEDLSAWRLRKIFGLSAGDAIKLLGISDTRSFWRRVKRAAQRIAALEEELIRFAKPLTE